jgi:hypothetical protein
MPDKQDGIGHHVKQDLGYLRHTLLVCLFLWVKMFTLEDLSVYKSNMPLFKGKKNIGRNIKTELAHGKPRNQAIAIALNVAGKKKKKVKKTKRMQDAEVIARMEKKIGSVS